MFLCKPSRKKKTKLEDSLAKIGVLEAEVNRLTQNLEDESQQNERLFEQVADLQQERNGLDQENLRITDEIKERHEDQMMALMESHKQLTEDKLKLAEKLKETEDKCIEISGEKSKLMSKIEDLSNEMEVRVSELQYSSTTVEELNVRLLSMEKAIQFQIDRNTELEKTVKKLEKENSSDSSETSEVLTREELNTRIKSLEEAVKIQSDKNVELQNKLKEFEDRAQLVSVSEENTQEPELLPTPKYSNVNANRDDSKHQIYFSDDMKKNLRSVLANKGGGGGVNNPQLMKTKKAVDIWRRHKNLPQSTKKTKTKPRRKSLEKMSQDLNVLMNTSSQNTPSSSWDDENSLVDVMKTLHSSTPADHVEFDLVGCVNTALKEHFNIQDDLDDTLSDLDDNSLDLLVDDSIKVHVVQEFSALKQYFYCTLTVMKKTWDPSNPNKKFFFMCGFAGKRMGKRGKSEYVPWSAFIFVHL